MNGIGRSPFRPTPGELIRWPAQFGTRFLVSSAYTSFSGNLPRDLQASKIAVLT